MINRRQFLAMAGHRMLALSTLPMAARWFVAPAEAAGTDHVLLTIFLRGGCDGLNCVVPYGDDDYHRLRPTIRIPAPGAGAEYPALNLDGFFGLHPSLSGLAAQYNQGRLAIFPAVHYANASRSHFEGQAMLEHAGASDGSGWLNRYLIAIGATTSMSAVALAQSAPAALKGQRPVRVLNGLKTTTLSVSSSEETLLTNALRNQYEGPGSSNDNTVMAALRASGAVALEDLDFLRGLGADSYSPGGGATYPAGAFGSQLRDAALLIKAELGLRVATIDFGGWDTHAGQGNGAPDGRQARALSELDAGLTAFMADLGNQSTRVAVLVMTEFGRTAAQNASGGTDHGNASAWFVLGGPTRGGIYLGTGTWPGLAPDRLREGRDLAHTVEFRNVLAELLTRHLGLPAADLEMALPGGATSQYNFI